MKKRLVLVLSIFFIFFVARGFIQGDQEIKYNPDESVYTFDYGVLEHFEKNVEVEKNSEKDFKWSIKLPMLAKPSSESFAVVDYSLEISTKEDEKIIDSINISNNEDDQKISSSFGENKTEFFSKTDSKIGKEYELNPKITILSKHDSGLKLEKKETITIFVPKLGQFKKTFISSLEL